MTYRSILVSSLLLLSARPCVAQTKPPAEAPAVATFDKIPEVAPPGTKVVVMDSSGNAVFGKVRSLTADSVTVKGPGVWGKTYVMKRDEIQTIRKPGDSSATGAIAGGFAGLGGALLIALFGNEDANNSWAFALIPIGAVGGYFADRASQDRRLLYAKPSGPKVSFERPLGAGLSVRADLGVVSPANRRPAPRAAANIVISLGASHRRNP